MRMNLLLLFLSFCNNFRCVSAFRRKHDLLSALIRANGTTQGTDVWLDVVFENDTPQPMERVSVIHKFNGVTPKTQALVWDNVGAWETTPPQRIKTTVGFWAGHFDWWVTSWRYKRVPGTYAKDKYYERIGCQKCYKEDGTCETWVTSGDGFFMNFFTDPMTYIKGAVAAANLIVGAMSLGVGAAVGTAIGGLVTEGIAGVLLQDDDTSGFYSKGVHTADYENSKKGIPIRVRTWRTNGRAHAVHVEMFAKGGKEDVSSGVEYVNYSRSEPPLEYRYRGAPVLLAKERVPIFKTVTSSKVIDRLTAGQRVTVAGRPRDDGSGHIMVPIKPSGAVQLKFFDVWKISRGEGLSWSNKPMPCTVNRIISQGHGSNTVPIRIHNKGSKAIKRLVLVHKHNGLTPRVRMRMFGPVAAGSVSIAQQVQTVSGFGFRSDWWMAAWQEDGQECVVKSTMSEWLFKSLISDPTEPLIKVSGAALETLLHTHFIGHVIDAGFHVQSHMQDELDPSGGLNGSAIDEILGLEVVHLLGKNTDTSGYMKCSLGQADVLNAESGKTIEIGISDRMYPEDGVSIRTAKGNCAAQILYTRCLQTQACAHSDACKLLNQGSDEFKKIAASIGEQGAMMGFTRAIEEALTAATT